MRIHGAYRILASLISVSVLTGSSPLQPISFQPQSRVWIAGTSTVRSFTCEATGLRGSVVPNSGETSLAVADLQRTVRTAEVTIPVQGLDCRNATMNGHLRNALKAAHHPTVRYELGALAIQGSGEEGVARMEGRLEIAGQERPITVDATVARDASGSLHVRGSKEILMTEFGVTPPSLMMGTMKVRDRVVVHFDVALGS